MIKSTLKTILYCLIAAAIGATTTLKAQDTNGPAEKKVAREKVAREKSTAKPAVTPFHGKLKAMDKTAKTITVGETTVQITSETKITKEGKPAVFDDAVVGDPIAGAYRKSAEGKLNATALRLGAKVETSRDAEPAKAKKMDK